MFGARFRTLLQYRAAAFAGFGTQLFWGLIRMMIFAAFYENASAAAPMSYEQVVAYVWLGQAFLGLYPYRIDRELEHMIRTGNVAYELLRPIDLYFFWYARSIANRTAPTLLRATPMLVVATLAGWIHWPHAGRLAGFAALMGVAVLLSSAVTMLMNVSMFWTISGRGINAVISSTMFLLSGMIVPLPMFPEAVQPVLSFLPFRAMCDVPFRLFAGHLALRELPAVVAHGLLWAAGLVLVGRWMLARAARRLVIQGG
jgi:ABC-2 type transport system permease protein